MALQVFTAVTGAGWESELVGALDRADHGVTVVRRCVDVPELLAAAATGTGQAALLSADLRRLDADVRWHPAPGQHGRAYWSAHLPDYLRFYSDALGARDG